MNSRFFPCGRGGSAAAGARGGAGRRGRAGLRGADAAARRAGLRPLPGGAAADPLRSLPERQERPALPDPPQESQIPKSQTPNPGIGAPSSPLRKRQRIPEAEKPEKKRDLGKSGKTGSENPKFATENPKFPPEIPKPALIPLEEFLEQEDWLEDDLGPSRKKARKNPWEFRESRRDHRIPDPGTSRVSSRESQTPEDSGKDPEDQQEFPGIDSDPPQVPESSGVIPNSSEIPESSGNSSQIPVLRIRIRIQDDVFLIPVAPRRERSVAWLAERAAERFSSASGTFPRLRLRKAGALLAPHDAVLDLLSSGDEVQAEIEGWDLPPLPERYRRVCASLGLAPFPPLLKLLELQSQNSRLEIPGGIRIPPAQIPAFLRSLKLQEQLRELRLRNLGIADSGISELGVTLVTLPRLVRLDLTGTGIGSDGIRSLCAAGEALK
ncbi:PREDICTED: tonsoku-like protein, partial [Pseudopodoces humilis]|uniref:tonsoku-like protein n=1 Tax=Pseudopodoces humilis TaxID=181119 RepID=UPI0006B87C31